MADNISRLPENWVFLSKEMGELKTFRDFILRKRAQEMKAWLEDVDKKVKEFDALEAKYSKLKDGSRRDRRALNTQVLNVLRSVNVLKDRAIAISESIEALFIYLTREKPNKFTHANLISFTSNFSTNNKIHPDGNVYKGKFPSGVEIVVKNLLELDVAEPTFMAEMNTMFRTSHRNLVQLYGFCFETKMKALVFAYMPNGSLDEILYDPRHPTIEWQKLYHIATETAKGLTYLHDGCVDQLLHRNLKPSSILLDSNMCPKITNFGVSKIMSRDHTHLTNSDVSWDTSYAAPEMTPSSPITHKCDVYSFGMVLFEVLGRRRNKDAEGRVHFPRTIWDKFENGEVEGILNECGIPEESREKALILCMVAFWCIQLTPENRPSMSIVVRMLEKEIKVVKPLFPFHPYAPSSVNRFVDVVYVPSDFGHQSLD